MLMEFYIGSELLYFSYPYFYLFHNLLSYF